MSDTVLRVSDTTSYKADSDWQFLRRPFWLFSHLFVGSALCLFVFAAIWQLARWEERKESNEIIRSRSDAPALSISEALAWPTSELDYVHIVDSGRFVEANLIRVANRSFDGQAGDWMLGLFETDDGQAILVNRGFVPREAETRDEEQATSVEGWLRLSQQKETFGATDNGTSERVPRLDVDKISERFGTPLAPVWVQQDELKVQEPEAVIYPLSVPLPELNNGPHFGYAVQWTIFTVLTAGAYALVLRKKSLEVTGSD